MELTDCFVNQAVIDASSASHHNVFEVLHIMKLMPAAVLLLKRNGQLHCGVDIRCHRHTVAKKSNSVPHLLLTAMLSGK